MTGPVERVLLTDEQLGLLLALPQHELWDAERAAAVPALVAELRASRAREQELQQRIDKALAECGGLAKIIESFTSDGDARSTAGGASVAIAAVRAALTGTET